MEFFGFLILIVCLVVGVRFGGLGLAAVSGAGLAFFVFVVGLAPGRPPVDVMLTIMAVVTCSGFLQASGGLDVMLKYAEKLLRRHPAKITVLAPVTTWFLTVLCGTGHVVYTIFPIIYNISIQQNIRPERPMAAASVASQMGICASPASVVVVSMAVMMAGTSYPVGVAQLLAVTVPATLCGVTAAGLWSLHRGKELSEDPEFQKKIADPEQFHYIYEESGDGSAERQLPRRAYSAALIFLSGIAVIALFGSFPSLFLPLELNSKGAWVPLSMTPAIQICMLVIAAVILLTCRVRVSQVANGSVFQSGMIAVVSVYGVAWMAETYFGAYLPEFRKVLGAAVVEYPWTYAIVLFVISKLVNSQAAAVAIVVPMALSIGVDPLIVISFLSACYGYFVFPTYPSDLACIHFDRSGTTKIGAYVLNHSFMAPGLIGVVTGCGVGYAVTHILYR